MKFRKKPVVVEAMQWTGDAASSIAVREWTGETGPENGLGLKPAFLLAMSEPPEYAKLWVAANQEWLKIERGEWVIQDARGFYPCKPDIFEATYEAVE